MESPSGRPLPPSDDETRLPDTSAGTPSGTYGSDPPPSAGGVSSAVEPETSVGQATTESGAGDAYSDEVPGHRAVVRYRRRRRIASGVAVVALLLVGYGLVSVFQVWSTGRSDDRDPVDAIVVMGAAQFDGRPSPTFAARLDHVVEIWPEGVAPLVVTTGGNLPGDRFTEAESGRNYLVDRGVPADAIVMEDEGSTTYESLVAVAALLDARDLDEIVIVTDPYHALRSRLIAESVGLEASVSSTTTSVVSGWSSVRRHVQEGAGVALGRIVGFERLDDWAN